MPTLLKDAPNVATHTRGRTHAHLNVNDRPSNHCMCQTRARERGRESERETELVILFCLRAFCKKKYRIERKNMSHKVIVSLHTTKELHHPPAPISSPPAFTPSSVSFFLVCDIRQWKDNKSHFLICRCQSLCGVEGLSAFNLLFKNNPVQIFSALTHYSNQLNVIK